MQNSGCPTSGRFCQKWGFSMGSKGDEENKSDYKGIRTSEVLFGFGGKRPVSAPGFIRAEKEA